MDHIVNACVQEMLDPPTLLETVRNEKSSGIFPQSGNA
jgi:hypothetical protein